ncbi:MAG: GNAT family N-acetyltransferase [Chloroflexi bacterium]|nr:GNAT family N-acetyltransferase [Chloroflexota bacterium]
MQVRTESEYPSRFENELVLRDGSTILLRPIRPDDAEKWVSFVSKLSNHTRYMRFHHVTKDLTMDDAMRFCDVDYINTFAFVAEASRDNRRNIVAVGRYFRLPGKNTAEVAFVTDDAYQRRGIGTGLMKWLVDVARSNGITTFEADVLSANEPMLSVIRDYGFHVLTTQEGGISHVSFPLTRTRRIIKREEERERVATVKSVRAILYPRSVAIIGASREPGTLGQLLFECVLDGRFRGTAYPVNPNAESILSVKAYPSVLDIPGEVDLAVIAVPAPVVGRIADECGRKGIHAIIVISDGFKERGPEGAIREKELRDITFCHGMRLIGPNCMGIINTDFPVSLNATFSTVYPIPGNVAFLSQSGAMGLVILEYASSLNIGISHFVSVGNRADISPNDLLQYWEADRNTRVILLYLESLGNPIKFGHIARRTSARKPVFVVKGGMTPAGSRAATTHTGAMATSNVVTDALFRQAGIIRVNTIEELFDVAALASNQPLPRGRRLFIVTNGGGPGITAADACSDHGILLPEPSSALVEAMRPGIRRDIRYGNPLDLTAGATADEFEASLRAVADDPDNDGALLIFIPPVVVQAESIAGAIARVAPLFRRQRKPLMACFMGQQGFKTQLAERGGFVPSYLFPESAVAALARTVEYTELSQKPRGVITRLRGINRRQAHDIISRALKASVQRPLWLTPEQIDGLLRAYGIRSVATMFASGADEAAALAAKIGFPVAVKLASATITHKSDVGGVVLNLDSAEGVKKAYQGIQQRLTELGKPAEMQGVVVQEMVAEGIETIVGVTQDPTFGPLVLFGLGGVYAEMLQDVVLRLPPLSNLDAREMISSVRMSRIFEGFRGSPPSDTASLQDLLLRVSTMIEDMPQILEMDLNPVKVLPSGRGYRVVDARIMVR